MHVSLRGVALSAVVGLSACSLLARYASIPDEPIGTAQVEIQQVRYDGEVLRLRVLIGAADGGVVVDRRLIENVHVTAASVRDCATGNEVEHLFVDYFAPPPMDADLLRLEPGYWFGSDLEYPFFVREKFTQAPTCIDVDFVVRLNRAAEPQVRLLVRGNLTAVDGGTPSVLDGGSPGDEGEGAGAHDR